MPKRRLTEQTAAGVFATSMRLCKRVKPFCNLSMYISTGQSSIWLTPLLLDVHATVAPHLFLKIHQILPPPSSNTVSVQQISLQITNNGFSCWSHKPFLRAIPVCWLLTFQGDFKTVEASRGPWEEETFHLTQTKKPDWKIGSGANDDSWKKHGTVEIDPYEEGRSSLDNYKLLISGIIPRPVCSLCRFHGNERSFVAHCGYRLASCRLSLPMENTISHHSPILRSSTTTLPSSALVSLLQQGLRIRVRICWILRSVLSTLSPSGL